MHTPNRDPDDDLPDDPAARLEWIARALGGDERATERLVRSLTPIVHYRVARVLRQHRPGTSWGRVRQEAEDLTQDLLVDLFVGRRLLEGWSPAKGLGLESFVDMVARRRTHSRLRPRRRDLYTEEAVPDEELDELSPEPDPERRAIARSRLESLLEGLREALTPSTWRLVERLWLKEEEVADVARQEDLNEPALYARVSRLRRKARELDL